MASGKGALLILSVALALVGLWLLPGTSRTVAGSILAVAVAALFIRGYASADLALAPVGRAVSRARREESDRDAADTQALSNAGALVRLPRVDEQLHLDAQASAGVMAASGVNEDVRRARVRAAPAQRAHLHGCGRRSRFTSEQFFSLRASACWRRCFRRSTDFWSIWLQGAA